MPYLVSYSADASVRKGRFSRVRNWILNGGPVDDGDNSRQPYLVCFHDWQQRRTMNDLARDRQNRVVNDNRQRPMRIRQIPQYVTAQRDAASDLGIPLSQVYPV
jgi:hypothetical protein